MPTILIVDDNRDTRDNFTELFRQYGYKTVSTEFAQKGLQFIKERKVDCAVIDIRLPDMLGIDMLARLKEEVKAGLIVIIVTAYADVSLAVKSIKLGAYDFLEKPFNNQALLVTVQRALESQQMKREIKQLRRSLGSDPDGEQIFGKSHAMSKALRQAEAVADTDLTVLVQGETGSGKEVMAHYLHRKSSRHQNQFITLDCGSIPENLIESELFGFQKGSFTGAVESKPGKFLQADNGTLYLDEIGNLPIEHQRRFLRIIEYKSFSPIGSKKEITVNTRIIVATNANLEKLVDQEKFRPDLFFRLSEYVIQIPPLRERVEDIPHLAKIILEEANIEMGRNVAFIDDEAMRKLISYRWPGNIRQLRNVIRRAILTANESLQAQHIVFQEKPQIEDRSDFVLKIQNQDLDQFVNLKSAYEQYAKNLETRLVKQAIESARGNLTTAARIYGTDRRNFYRILNRLQITNIR